MPIMQKIADTFSCNLHEYNTNKNKQYLCINVSAIEKLSLVVNYFKNYKLLGIKSKNFND
jgi:LAGLIDADG endonuclease